MEIFFGILIILAIVFWRHLIRGLFGAFIFGLIGAIFGENWALAGAGLGFITGVAAENENNKEKKKKGEKEGDSKPEPEIRQPHTTSSSGSNVQLIRCPGCDRMIRVGLPLKQPNAKCPACLAEFELSVDDTGKVRIGQTKRWEHSRQEKQEGPKAKSGESTVDDYAVLGVAASATPDEVRAAYRKKIREYHPDRVAGLGEKLQEMANEESKLINNAYSRLRAAGLAS